MRRFALGLLIAASLAGCGSDDDTGATGSLANLVVTVDDDGAHGSQQPRELKLDCSAATDSAPCEAAAALTAADLKKTPADTACTQIFGGPEEATIKGELHGEPVDATFSRRDGCEIERWDRVKPLLAEVR